MNRGALRTAIALSGLAAVLFGPPARAEDEGEVRQRRRQEQADRFALKAGTRDLRDAYRRAADAVEKERAREKKAAAKKRASPSALASAPAWTAIGPLFNPTFASPIGSAKVGQDDTGLITAIAVHPTEGGTIIVGAAGGGLWKTVDAGATWKAVADTLPAGGLSIGAVAYAPSNPSRVYAGTSCGDSSTTKLGRPADALIQTGLGFLVSNDGGETWGRLPNVPADFFWGISVDPASPDTLVIAGDRGVYRSTDGGATWAAVLVRQGEGLPIFANALSRSAASPNVLYAGLFRPGQDAGQVFKSTDGGATWASKSEGLPGNPETRGRAQVAVAPSDPNRVYVLVANTGDKQIDMAASTDGGDSWRALNLSGQNPPADILGTQGGFANVVAVDPQNPDIVYAGGLDMWKSTDAGVSFRKITDWSPPTPQSTLAYLHADQHAVVFGPSGAIYAGNDGGIYRSTDGGTGWTSLNKGIMGWLVDEICISDDASVILNGAQDNGTSLRLQGTDWVQVGGGDGFGCLVHPTNKQILTISVNNQGIQRSIDGGKTFEEAQGLTDAGAAGNKSAWRTQLVQHPTESGRIFTFSKRKIWQSDDNGANWKVASDFMPVIDDIADIAIAPDGNRMLLVDEKGAVVESTDAGKTWAKKGELPVGRASAVRPDRANAQTIYATSTILTAQRERVWASTDGGANWLPISKTNQEGGLPDLPVYTIEQDRKDPGVLWAGAFTGLYRSGDAGQTWQRHGTGLPNVPVTAIAFPADASKVIIGTSGRGMWETAAAPGAAAGVGTTTTAATAPKASFTFSPANPRPGQSVTFKDASEFMTSWSWDFGDGSAKSTKVNPSHIFAQTGSYKVRLTVSNGTQTDTKEATVTVALPSTGTGDALTYLLPVLVRSAGQGGTNFGTELTLSNRSGQDLALTFRATTIAGSAAYTLKPGQVVFADVFAFLSSLGLAMPEGTIVSPLRIEVRGVQALGLFGAQVRVTTPPNTALAAQGISGRFGLSFLATPLAGAANREAYLYGLQQTSVAGQPGARTNLACVNAGGGSNGTVKLEITYRNGETGLSHALKDTIELGAFQFAQKGEPLGARGLQNGFAQIRRVAGDDQFVCYATVIDNLNGDSAFVPMVVTDEKSDSTEAMVPVVLDVAGYKSELTISNRTPLRLAFEFAVIPSGSAEPEFGEIDIEPLSQTIFPDIIGELRDSGFDTPAGTVASMYFSFQNAPSESVGKGAEVVQTDIPASDVYVGVRTYASKAGGQFGLAYPGSPVGKAADTQAWVFGLQQTGVRGQDGGTRSNLAIVHALGGEEEDLSLEITYFDGSAKELGKEQVSLKAGQWKQINTPLARYEGVTTGYARITRLSGTDQFIAYGVLNDQANDDGSFVSMIVP